jgi:hypothetical protein
VRKSNEIELLVRRLEEKKDVWGRRRDKVFF